MKRLQRLKRSCAAGAVLTSVLAGSAMAADMPLKAPPVPRVVSDWTGFYIGVHGGYGWARPSITDFDLNNSNPQAAGLASLDENFSLRVPRLSGAVFGGHAGYNWQWGQRGIVGLEIDYSAADIKRTQGVTANFTDCCEFVGTRTLQSKLDSLASARARVGFLVGPEFLLYGTGGAAWGHTKFTDTDERNGANVALSQASANHFGWVAGAGAEWKRWNSGLMLRVEYLHYDFGSASLAFDTILHGLHGIGTKGASFNVPVDRLTTDVVRGGVSYKF